VVTKLVSLVVKETRRAINRDNKTIPKNCLFHNILGMVNGLDMEVSATRLPCGRPCVSVTLVTHTREVGDQNLT
jgi:hypothetical protein